MVVARTRDKDLVRVGRLGEIWAVASEPRTHSGEMQEWNNKRTSSPRSEGGMDHFAGVGKARRRRLGTTEPNPTFAR